MFTPRKVFSRSFAASATLHEETGTNTFTARPYMAIAFSRQAGVKPPTTFGISATLLSGFAGSSRSGEKARWKSTPAFILRPLAPGASPVTATVWVTACLGWEAGRRWRNSVSVFGHFSLRTSSVGENEEPMDCPSWPLPSSIHDPASSTARNSSSVVPGYVVDSNDTSVPFCKWGAMARPVSRI